MKIIVTGVNGFVGEHLARELKTRGHQVVGLGREPRAKPDRAGLLADYVRCDLTNEAQVQKIPLDDIHAIINLAGLAQVGASFNNPKLYKEVNVAVLAVLGQRLVKQKSGIRLIAISTGAVYNSRQPLPLTESSALDRQASPYTESKILMEEKAQELRSAGLDCVLVRPFNHIGPGQEPGFLVPDLYQKIRTAIASGQPVTVGTLKTRRDYTDVRDVVRAYADLAEKTKLDYKLYNVCSGHSVAGEQILQLLIKAYRTKSKVGIKTDPALNRPNDPQNLYGSHDRLTKEVGWSPKISLDQTIEDFVVSKT